MKNVFKACLMLMQTQRTSNHVIRTVTFESKAEIKLPPKTPFWWGVEPPLARLHREAYSLIFPTFHGVLKAK